MHAFFPELDQEIQSRDVFLHVEHDVPEVFDLPLSLRSFEIPIVYLQGDQYPDPDQYAFKTSGMFLVPEACC